MSDLSHREQLELRLKTEFDEAEQMLRHATPEALPEARRIFRGALHNFKLLLIDGKVPLSLVKKSAP